MLIGSALLMFVSYLFSLAIFTMIVIALITALAHPGVDYAYAQYKKNLWLAILIVAVILGVDRIFLHLIPLIPSFIKTFAYWACIFGAAYFLGTEHSRMARSGGFAWREWVRKWRGNGGNGSRGSHTPRGSW